MKKEVFVILEQVKDLLNDVEIALTNVHDSLSILEGIDWSEAFSHLPDSEMLLHDVEMAVGNIRDNLNDLQRGVCL